MIVDYDKITYEQDMAAVKNAISEVAIREGKTIAEIRGAMMEAIEMAFNNPEPKVQAMWAQIPRKGIKPTPEEFMIWASKRL